MEDPGRAVRAQPITLCCTVVVAVVVVAEAITVAAEATLPAAMV
jgi:hypothetical protein